MNEYAAIGLSLGLGYLLGSIPFAVIIAKAHGVDIFKQGSGNPGATNVKRVLGSKAGNFCFALDVLKGAVASGWPLATYTLWPQHHYMAIAGLVGAILGHSFSIFLRFRGGKGVAVTIGGLLSMLPLVILIGLVAWVAVYYLTKIVSVSSIVMGLSLPGSSWLLDRRLEYQVLCVILAIIIVVRHHSNIRRLIQGEEHGFKPKRLRKTEGDDPDKEVPS